MRFTPCVQGSHAALAFGIHACKHGLGAHHGVVADVADEFFGGGPGLLVRLTHDDVQADAELHGAAVLGGTGAHIGHLLGDLGRGSPQVRYVSTCSAARSCAAGMSRQSTPADVAAARAEEQLGALHRQVLAFKVRLSPWWLRVRISRQMRMNSADCS